jgi:copper homeostasis protein
VSDRLLEICCDSLESARAAAEGGADRIELCVDLAADGLTPSRELLADAGELPVFVLVRCRPGDFVYTDAEVRAMCADIEAMREAGAAGIVCGALRGSGEIDLNATHRLIAAAEGLPFTFHKAFDLCPDQERSMERLAGLGVERVLTSGGERYAVDAMERLAKLATIGGGTTAVLCGGGVRATGLRELVKIPGVTEFHSAARASVGEPVDVGEVRAMRAILACR